MCCVKSILKITTLKVVIIVYSFLKENKKWILYKQSQDKILVTG